MSKLMHAFVGAGLAAWVCGARAEVVLGSWNIQTLAVNGVVFPDDYRRSEADFALLRAARDQVGADVLALQEVTSPRAVSQVFPLSEYVIYFSGQYDADAAGLAPHYPRDRLQSIKPTCYDQLGVLPDPPAGEARRHVRRHRHPSRLRCRRRIGRRRTRPRIGGRGGGP
jgi:hypothetical protein